jgi:hypothetical protein
MDIWGWLAVYVVGLTLLQLLLYRYVRDGEGGVANDYLDERPAEGTDRGGRHGGTARRSGTPDRPRDQRGRHERPRNDRTDPPAGNGFDARTVRATPRDDGRRVCPHCGTENHDPEGAFRYCQRCVRPL